MTGVVHPSASQGVFLVLSPAAHSLVIGFNASTFMLSSDGREAPSLPVSTVFIEFTNSPAKMGSGLGSPM